MPPKKKPDPLYDLCDGESSMGYAIPYRLPARPVKRRSGKSNPMPRNKIKVDPLYYTPLS